MGDAPFACRWTTSPDRRVASSNGSKRATAKPSRETGTRLHELGSDRRHVEAIQRLRPRALGKNTDNDWQTIAGKKDQLVGRIQERYRVTNAEAEKQADEWMRAITESKHESRRPSTRL